MLQDIDQIIIRVVQLKPDMKQIFKQFFSLLGNTEDTFSRTERWEDVVKAGREQFKELQKKGLAISVYTL